MDGWMDECMNCRIFDGLGKSSLQYPFYSLAFSFSLYLFYFILYMSYIYIYIYCALVPLHRHLFSFHYLDILVGSFFLFLLFYMI